MKISFVEPHLKTYGGIRRIIELSNRLTARGHTVTIFHSDGSPCTWMTCTARIKPAAAFLAEEHDVVIYNDPDPIDYALVANGRAKLKVFYVLELYNTKLLAGRSLALYLPRNTRMRILRDSLRAEYLILANATWEQAWLKKYMNIDAMLLLGGVNTDMFHPVPVKKDLNEIRVLCSGDPRERKGTDTIRQAIAIAQRQEPRIVLETYHGKGIPQEGMAATYSAADIFLEGSWQAGWNNPVAEAMACKVPVICTAIGGVQDFAFHEKTALLVPPKDPQAMAEALLRLIRDVPLRDTLRENAYAQIRKFTWDESAARLEELLRYHLRRAELNPAYLGIREDILRLIPKNVRRVLDVGCAAGALGEKIKERFGTAVTGVELDDQAACLAQEKLDRVIHGDIETMHLADIFGANTFDCVIFADLLEHLKNPWAVLTDVTTFVQRGGTVIASLPNIRHYSTISNLLFRGRWPYRERGIHDRTHLRFFTLQNIRELFQGAGLKIVTIERNYRIIERPHRLNRFAKYLALPFLKDFFTYQYLIVAKKEREHQL